MVKAQEWLNKTFPTQESREKVKILGFTKGGPSSSGNVGGEEVKFENEWGKEQNQQITNLEEKNKQTITDLKQQITKKNEEINNLCQLQKELICLEQQQSQMETKILQIELPKLYGW